MPMKTYRLSVGATAVYFVGFYSDKQRLDGEIPYINVLAHLQDRLCS